LFFPLYLHFFLVRRNERERKDIRFGSLNATLSLCSLMKDVSNQFDLTSNPGETETEGEMEKGYKRSRCGRQLNRGNGRIERLKTNVEREN